MMENEYGLDVSYFESKLKLVVRDCERYTPKEIARELTRLALTADERETLDETERYLEKAIKDMSE